MDDELYMDEAFALAERGRGSTHPNPLVGAVLVRDGEVVGRGWHLAPGEPHAEAMALAEAGERARGATLYCTLEPCSHHGKTPPCADALVAAGVTRAVIALGDPNPQVDGRGLRKLRDGGVEVDLAEDRWGARAREQNAPFLKYHRTGRPLVTYKAAVTLDGKVAAAGGDARWISCLDSRRAVHELRSRVDAVMVGAGTVRRDDPELTVRLADGRTPSAWSSRTTAPCRRAPRCWRPRARRAPSWSPTRRPRPRAGSWRRAAPNCSKWAEGGLPAALEALAGLGLLDVLCEGGPTLAGELLAAGLIDRVLLFVAPLIVGRGAPDLFAAPAVSAVDGAWRLRDVQWRSVCDDLLLSGTIVRKGD